MKKKDKSKNLLTFVIALCSIRNVLHKKTFKLSDWEESEGFADF